jgi:CheY-like chemotaxis protein
LPSLTFKTTPPDQETPLELTDRELTRFFVAEDQVVNRNMLKHSLESRLGISPRRVTYGKDGLEAFSTIMRNLKMHVEHKDRKEEEEDAQLYDLLIIDYCLPVMNGLELIKKCQNKFK